jgi:hypothetical protein
MPTAFLTPRLIAFECLYVMANDTKEGEFGPLSQKLTTETLIISRGYSFDPIAQQSVENFCRKVASEFLADIRATGRREFAELPLPEVGQWERVTDKELGMSIRLAFDSNQVRCEAALN